MKACYLSEGNSSSSQAYETSLSCVWIAGTCKIFPKNFQNFLHLPILVLLHKLLHHSKNNNETKPLIQSSAETCFNHLIYYMYHMVVNTSFQQKCYCEKHLQHEFIDSETMNIHIHTCTPQLSLWYNSCCD